MDYDRPHSKRRKKREKKEEKKKEYDMALTGLRYAYLSDERCRIQPMTSHALMQYHYSKTLLCCSLNEQIKEKKKEKSIYKNDDNVFYIVNPRP